jgi:putative peptide zinc metalloprotease protein
VAVDENTATVRVAAGSRVVLRALCQRRARDGWVVGRIETGDFIAVPEVAHHVITLLEEGLAIGDIAGRLQAETGTSFAVADFVTALDELGFVAAVDDRMRTDNAPPQPSLPWLRPGHVRWLMHPLLPAVVAGFAVAAVVVLVLHPALLPSYRVLVWSGRAGVVLAVNAAIAWMIILVHELAHVATARAAGVPGRITLGTRLQFLAAQTDVSGVWAAPRRTRMTVYLAGMGIDVCCASSCLLIAGLGGVHGLARHLLAVAAAETLLGLLAEFMVFMRTDIYFVLQDLTGCANLYADGSAFLRYLCGRVTRGLRHASGQAADPSRQYPAARRRAVRLYSVLLLAGTAICLTIEFMVSLPALIALVGHAISEIATTPVATTDGSVALVILLGFQLLWASRWWHRHQHQVRSIAAPYLQAVKGAKAHGRHLPDAR